MAVHEERVSVSVPPPTMSSEDPQLSASGVRVTFLLVGDQDVLQGMEDQVWARIADRWRGTPAVIIPTTDDDSDREHQL